jgi:hypothetical protein
MTLAVTPKLATSARNQSEAALLTSWLIALLAVLIVLTSSNTGTPRDLFRNKTSCRLKQQFAHPALETSGVNIGFRETG